MSKVVIRILTLLPALILQALWVVLLALFLAPFSSIIGLVLQILAVIIAIHLMGKREESTYKELWLMGIVGFPIIGTFLYILFGNKRTGRGLFHKLKKADDKYPRVWQDNHDDVIGDIYNDNKRIASTFHMLEEKTAFPVRRLLDIKYYPLGELAFEDMLLEMDKAQETIYLEYFIIEGGKMWDSMVDIMTKKVSEGVDVRVIYDDLGSFATYSKKEVIALRDKGIQCIAFNPATLITGRINYRSHRKMLIIDGKIAFSGGINLADEYINEIHPYGHWKDIAFRITGQSVINYTWMFTQFWHAFATTPLDCKITSLDDNESGNGYILSYYDSPVIDGEASNSFFIDLLAQAKDYAWFYTPYLMPGSTLIDALINAATRGIDVKIITPGTSDSKVVARMARSYYETLLKAGVKIYEYTPGFVHAKASLVDDELGSIGTVNMDYRSLYLHFENNSVFYKSSVLDDLKRDYLDTLSKCSEITLESMHMTILTRFIDNILKFITPLC